MTCPCQGDGPAKCFSFHFLVAFIPLTLCLSFPAGRHPAAPDRGGPPSSPRLLRTLQPRLRHRHPRLPPVPGPQPGRIRKSLAGFGDAFGAAASSSVLRMQTRSASFSCSASLLLICKARDRASFWICSFWSWLLPSGVFPFLCSSLFQRLK